MKTEICKTITSTKYRKKIKMKTIEMELALAKHFDVRRNIIVPNVSWGMFLYEMDLVVLTPSGYLTEIEIKISKQDLKKDLDKKHKHKDYKNRVKYLYFAIPEKLEKNIDLIPERAGIIIVRNKFCDIIRKPKQLSKYKFTEKERYKLTRLGAIRVWSLKTKINKIRKEK